MTSPRRLEDWLKSYLDYVENTESALIFKTWVGISVLAASLRRKVSFKLGRIMFYPNLYVVLVGPPGSRKSQAIKFGFELIKKIESIHLSADAPTREALIMDLDQSGADYMTDNEDPTRHCSLTAISSELETFLGNKKENARMLNTLTDLWDCPDEWKYRTKNSGTNGLVNVFLNLVGATTPESIANCIPASASGTGFTSRIMFCYADQKHIKVPEPEETLEILQMKEELICDLDIISRMEGVYTFSDAGRLFWHKWYQEYDDLDPKRICQDNMFNGWYERKPTFILKISLIMAASRGDTVHIEPYHMKEALRFIEQSEECMDSSFRVVGRSEIAAELDLVINIIKAHGHITEMDLMRIVWKDVDAKKLENIIDTAVKSGKITRDYPVRGGAELGMSYTWKGVSKS